MTTHIRAIASALMVVLLAVAALQWVRASNARQTADMLRAELDATRTANAAWEEVTARLQSSLEQCTREREEIKGQGTRAVDRVRGEMAALSRSLAEWRTHSEAAESLPHCRAVMEMEICAELSDY
jgi:chromosome segregation ATPase